MIAFLPALHDDELFSSLLMRLFEEGAYIYPKNFLSEILDGKQRFNYLYVNRLKPELIDLLDKTYGWKSIIQNHTLEGWNNLFGKYSGASPTKGFIRYCPKCLKEKKYIQLLPQIQELGYCAEHGCKFINSKISLDRKTNYLIRPISDFLCQNDEIIKQINLSDINVKIGQYISEVLNVSRTGHKQTKISEYIRAYIPLGYFISKTRTQINIDKLKKDLNEFYSDLENYTLAKRSLKAVLLGESFNPFTVILIAYWLGIKPYDLVNRKANWKESPLDKILLLKKSGLSERTIAKQIGISKTCVHKRLQKAK